MARGMVGAGVGLETRSGPGLTKGGQDTLRESGNDGVRTLLALSGGLQPDLYASETLTRSLPPTSGSPLRRPGILLSPTTGVLTRARVAVHRRERAGSEPLYAGSTAGKA